MTAVGFWCCWLELSGTVGPQSIVPPDPGQRWARALVRMHGEPLGYVTVRRGDPVEAMTCEIVAAAWQAFGDVIRQHLAEEGLPDPGGGRIVPQTDRCQNRITPGELVSVVVCTRNRSETLRACLASLADLTYPAVEFIVVDNAPTDDSTERAVAERMRDDQRFRYVVEPRPGLSRARNRGLAASRGRYIAFTDDDVRVDRHWVDGLIRGFRRRQDVGCVTGLVCTAQVTNEAEAYFDARTPLWSSRCAARLFDLQRDRVDTPLYPYTVGIFGTGANFSVDRALLGDLRGFDEALGTGTPSRGAEDLDLFLRVLQSGRAIAYEPAALVWHHHRGDNPSLRRQMFAYGAGLAAFLTKLTCQRSTRSEIIRRIPAGLRRFATIRRTTEARLAPGLTAPLATDVCEYVGFCAGPVLYLRSRIAARFRPPAPGSMKHSCE